MQRWYNISKLINVIHHINKMKDKNHMIISIDAEKAFDKIQHPFTIKNSLQSGNWGNVPKHNKGHIWQTQCQHHTQWAKLQVFPLRLGTRQGCPLSSLLCQTRRRNKRHSSWKGRSKAVIICRWHDTIHREPQRFHQETTRTDKWIQQSNRIQY